MPADLAKYLSGQRDNSKRCWCETTDPALVKQVEEVVNGGSRQWAAITRWLEDQGVELRNRVIRCHFDGRHDG